MEICCCSIHVASGTIRSIRRMYMQENIIDDFFSYTETLFN